MGAPFIAQVFFRSDISGTCIRVHFTSDFVIFQRISTEYYNRVRKCCALKKIWYHSQRKLHVL